MISIKRPNHILYIDNVPLSLVHRYRGESKYNHAIWFFVKIKIIENIARLQVTFPQTSVGVRLLSRIRDNNRTPTDVCGEARLQAGLSEINEFWTILLEKSSSVSFKIDQQKHLFLVFENS